MPRNVLGTVSSKTMKCNSPEIVAFGYVGKVGKVVQIVNASIGIILPK
jgi:hypothetical protein